MKEKSYFQVGDVLYSVDPMKLRVRKFNVVEVDPNSDKIVLVEYARNKVIQIQNQLAKFPVKIGQLLYFKSEDDAHEFIQIQIGM